MNRRLFSKIGIITLCACIAGGVISCGKDESPKPPKATTLELVSGEAQTAMTEDKLANPIQVIVKDQNGAPFAGEVLNFAVTEGSVSAATATTDANGKASVEWTLGATEGIQTLTITSTNALSGSPLEVTATASYRPVIGDFKFGGVIFYIDETGEHGLVCAVRNIMEEVEWGCEGTEISGADDSSIGSGYQNTLDILNGCSTLGTAADSCVNLSLYGYSDWYLPSIEELELIKQKRTVIDETALNNGGTALRDNYYWSSTEYQGYDNMFAYYSDFIGGSLNGGYKYNKNDVRPVRSF